MTTRPQIRLRPKVSPQPIRFGAPWVFADQLVMDRRTKGIPSGSIVDLADGEGSAFATVAFNPESKIAARVLERRAGVEIDAAWLRDRVQKALRLREDLFDAPFYRLVHAEAEGLPGVIIDRFGDAAVIQPNAAWSEMLFGALAEAVADVTGVRTIVKNASGRARKLEGLDEETLIECGGVDAPIQVPMNGAVYLADLVGGQKTGLFYDQRPNHAFAARLGQGRRVLDVFSHVGGFAFAALAGGANSALSVDGSAAALELAEAGAKASGLADRFATRRGDAFEVMSALDSEAERFGLVICDPPAFAPSKPALEAGLRAYERVARLGARLVESGGYLVLCSCSHAADLGKFRDASLRGVGKAGRSAQIIHTGAAGPDHPVHPYLAESSYLKALFLRLD